MNHTYEYAPAIETIDLVSEIRPLLLEQGGGVKAAQHIENHIAQVVLSHLEEISALLPIGFYPDESLPSRVRIMRQHWDKMGEVMEENGNLKRQLARLK